MQNIYNIMPCNHSFYVTAACLSFLCIDDKKQYYMLGLRQCVHCVAGIWDTTVVYIWCGYKW